MCLHTYVLTRDLFVLKINLSIINNKIPLSCCYLMNGLANDIFFIITLGPMMT